MNQSAFRSATLAIFGAFMIWLTHFGALYGFTGLMCARPSFAGETVLGFGIIPFTIGVITLAALAALAWMFLRPTFRSPAAQSTARFVSGFQSAAALLAALAIVWQAIPVIVIKDCV